MVDWSLHVNMPQPSEHNTYTDIEAAYKCLEESYGAKQEDIILYGQSVGSGPTVDLASRLPRLRAVVLHSPISSGLRVMYPVKRTYWFDIYKVNAYLSITDTYSSIWSSFWYQFIQQDCWFLQNIDKIPSVKCPVLVIHVSEHNCVISSIDLFGTKIVCLCFSWVFL